MNDYFEASAVYWKDIYSGDALSSTIYRTRQSTALRWIAELSLPACARVLEVGCGAGLTTAALARNGHTVDAIDSTVAMLRMTRKRVVRHGFQERVRLHLADVHALPFEAGAFDLVIAIGVIPWLHSERIALQEMQRVLRPGGYLLVTADNNARLNRLVDPLSSPALKPLRLTVKHLLKLCRSRPQDPRFQAKRHYPRQINRLIADCNFRRMKWCTLGFGPFTVFGKPLFDDLTGVELHRRFQTLAATRGFFPLRWTGCHHLVLAQKES